MQHFGKYIIIFGAVILIIGLIVYLWGDKLNWLFNLPGDIKVEKENFRFYFPIVTMIIISVVITVIVNLLRKLF
ncbi:MAG: DUF2905 domain-containing protein [Bacteroidetes bacterium]|nr:DUF2905 domain-containing protein [Bacteroidota bacterium]